MRRVTRHFLLAAVLAVLSATVAAVGIVLAGAEPGGSILPWCAVFAAALPLFMVILNCVPGAASGRWWALRLRSGKTDWDADFEHLLEEMER